MAQTKTAAAVTPIIVRTHPSVWTKAALVTRSADGTMAYEWLKPVKHASRMVRIDVPGDGLVYLQRANFNGDVLGDPLRIRQYLRLVDGAVEAKLDYSGAKTALGIAGAAKAAKTAEAAAEMPAGAIVL